MDERGEAGVLVRISETAAGWSFGCGGGQRGLVRFGDALEAAGLEPHLANPLGAKSRCLEKNKTDAPDAQGVAILLRVGTSPEVSLPAAKVRDLRGLLRTRLAMRSQGVF